MATNEQPLVVIIGAGIAGTNLALALRKKRRPFLLINASEYVHVNFAAVRACCVKGWAERSLIPLQPTFGDSFKHGLVVNIDTAAANVKLESGEEISYGILVIATGLKQMWPFKVDTIGRDQCISMYDELVSKVESSQKISVVGGGATGIETAAELASFYPNKQITLIHSSTHLLHPGLSPRSQAALQNQLTQQFNITLVLGEKVQNLDEIMETGSGVLLTDKEKSIETDLAYKCTGVSINTSAYESSLSSVMTDRGSLRVNLQFQVDGFENIYAIGDCTNIDEPKLGALAQKHAEVLAKTILNLDRGKSPVTYKPDNLPTLTGVSLGPRSGFARTKKDWKLPAFLIARLKSKHLFLDVYSKNMGVKYMAVK